MPDLWNNFYSSSGWDFDLEKKIAIPGCEKKLGLYVQSIAWRLQVELNSPEKRNIYKERVCLTVVH